MVAKYRRGYPSLARGHPWMPWLQGGATTVPNEGATLGTDNAQGVRIQEIPTRRTTCAPRMSSKVTHLELQSMSD